LTIFSDREYVHNTSHKANITTSILRTRSIIKNLTVNYVTDVLIISFRTSVEISLQYNVRHYSVCSVRCWQGYYANYLKT